MLRKLALVHLLASSALLSAQEAPTQPDAPAPAPAQPPAVEAPAKIAPTGLRQTPGKAIVPGGVILHVQLNSAQKLLGDLDGLLTSFLPGEILPPKLRPLLEQPNPALAIAGAQTMGMPFTTASLTQFTGLDSSRPATLDFLFGPPAEAWVLSLPVAIFDLFSGMFAGIVRPTAVEEAQLMGGRGYVVKPGNSDLPPKLIVLASDDTVYVCGSEHAAQTVLMAAGGSPGPEATFFSTVLADYQDRDLVFAASPVVLRPMLPGLLAQAQALPPMAFASLRQFVDRMPPLERAKLEMRLRFRFGLPDLETCLQIAEAFGYSGWELLVNAVATEAQALQGVAWAVDLDASRQSLVAALYSETIKQDNGPSALDPAAVSAALASVPGERMWASARGGRASSSSPSVWTQWFQAAIPRLQEKDVDVQGLVALLSTMESVKQPETLDQHVPWLAQVIVPQPAIAPAQEFTSLVEFIQAYAVQAPRVAGSVVTVFPKQELGGLGAFFEQQAEARQHNEDAWLRHPIPGGNARWFSIHHRASAETNGDVAKVNVEKAWVTNSGLFGASQHELINRTIRSFRNIGGHTYMQKQVSVGDDRLTEMEPVNQPLPEALAQLMAEAPEGSHAVSVWRVLPTLLNVVGVLNDVETVAHRELDQYLTEANAAWAQGGQAPADEEARTQAVTRLQEIEMPPTVRALCADADGRLYTVLPPALQYPRPSLVPLVRELLADYASVADTVGGGAVYHRTTDGKSEVQIVLRTDGLGALVQSTVNKFARTYLAEPQGMPKLMATVKQPNDGRYVAEEVVVLNPLWTFIDQIMK